MAVSLAHYGLESYFVTKLPQYEMGQAAVNYLRRFGVRTDFIVRGGERIGIYFLETGASQRPSKVIYDRAHAAITTLREGEVDWDRVFEGARWFHWTGITPALGEGVRLELRRALEAARRAGVKVSADLNYRAKLWSVEEAQRVMRPLMEYVDVCIANEEDAEKSLAIKPRGVDVEAGELDEAVYGELALELKRTFGFEAVAMTLRESYSASVNGWSALMVDDWDCRVPYRSRRYEIQLVDRVGGGDAFAGGLIYGFLTKENTREALEFAVAASCLKQTIPGDFNLVSVEEVEKLAKGSGAGRVER